MGCVQAAEASLPVPLLTTTRHGLPRPASPALSPATGSAAASTSLPVPAVLPRLLGRLRFTCIPRSTSLGIPSAAAPPARPLVPKRRLLPANRGRRPPRALGTEPPEALLGLPDHLPTPDGRRGRLRRRQGGQEEVPRPPRQGEDRSRPPAVALPQPRPAARQRRWQRHRFPCVPVPSHSFSHTHTPMFRAVATGNAPQRGQLRRGKSLLGREEDQHESGLALFKRGTLRRKRSSAGAAANPGEPPKSRDRKSTRLNSSHSGESRMPSSA